MLPGGWEWFIILIVALLLFGSRLPDVMRNLGSSVKEFKKGMNDITESGLSDTGKSEETKAQE